SSWAADMSGPGEVDHYLPGLALEITDLDCVAVARGELREQGKGIVVIDEAHGLARAEAVHGAEYRGVPKALRDAARVENVGRLGQLVGGSHVRSRLSGCWEGSAPCRRQSCRRAGNQRCKPYASNLSAAIPRKQCQAYIFGRSARSPSLRAMRKIPLDRTATKRESLATSNRSIAGPGEGPAAVRMPQARCYRRTGPAPECPYCAPAIPAACGGEPAGAGTDQGPAGSAWRRKEKGRRTGWCDALTAGGRGFSRLAGSEPPACLSAPERPRTAPSALPSGT